MKLINAALISKHKIFDTTFQSKLQSRQLVERSGYIFLYYPYRVSPGVIDGIKLKDNKGFIAIQETYKILNKNKDLEKVSYVYRYITNEIVYLCEHSASKISEIIPYSFHYDMDMANLDPKHPSRHLQVIHTQPRFETEDVNIIFFLNCVTDLCFKNEKLEPYTEPLFIRK